MTSTYRPSDLSVSTVVDLQQEAAQAGDQRTVADCVRVCYWLQSGAAARGVRSRAAVRVARVLSGASAQQEAR